MKEEMIDYYMLFSDNNTNYPTFEGWSSSEDIIIKYVNKYYPESLPFYPEEYPSREDLLEKLFYFKISLPEGVPFNRENILGYVKDYILNSGRRFGEFEFLLMFDSYEDYELLYASTKDGSDYLVDRRSNIRVLKHNLMVGSGIRFMNNFSFGLMSTLMILKEFLNDDYNEVIRALNYPLNKAKMWSYISNVDDNNEELIKIFLHQYVDQIALEIFNRNILYYGGDE